MIRSKIFFLSLMLACLSAVGQKDYWAIGKEYHYNAVYKDNTGKVITSEQVSIIPTGETWEIDPQQTLATYRLNFSSADSTRLAPIPLNGVMKEWKREYQEGVISNDKKVWMHPVRVNQYILTEVAPFPEVQFPLKEGLSWTSTLWVYKAFGSFEGTVECSYKVSKKESRTYSFGKLNCWRIDATAVHDKLGVSTTTIYFEEEIGFVELDYKFYNGQTLNFSLERYR